MNEYEIKLTSGKRQRKKEEKEEWKDTLESFIQ